MNVFRTNLRTTLGDIAQTDAELIFQQMGARQTVKGMHFQSGNANEEARPTKLFLLFVISQNMTDVLAKETLDALAKLLHAVHVALIHLPFDIRTRTERWDLSVDTVIPRYICHQVSDDRKTLHRLDNDWFTKGQGIQASLAC